MDAQLNYRLSSLSPAKRRLVLRRLLDAGHAIEALPICRQPGEASLDADTFDAQDRLLTLESLRPGTMYNRISLALLLRGNLDRECLRFALRDLGARHEGLRTRFTFHDGCWRQSVADRCDIDLTVVDLRCLASSVQDSEVERHRGQFDSQPLDLEIGPPWRASLLRLGDESHILLLCLHHAAADGWSADVLARDLSHAYRSRLQDSGPVWPHPALQPREYAQFWHDLSACGALDRRAAGPRPAAETEPNVTSVPADFIRPEHKSDRSGIVTRELDSARHTALCAVSKQTSLTLAAIYTAAALISLREFSGEQDLLVAFALANRDHPETHDLVAPLVTVRPLRIKTDDSETMGGFAARVQRELAQLATGCRTVTADRHEGTTSSSPAPRCLLVVQNAYRSLIDFPGIDTEVLAQRRAGALYDLTIVFQSFPDAGRISVEYAEDLFTAGTAEQLARRVAETLRIMTTSTGCPIADATRPDLDEALGYLTPTAGVEDASLRAPIDHILEQAATRPDAIAIDAPAGRISYAELVQEAQGLARALPHGANGDARPIAIMTADGALAATAMVASQLVQRPFVMLDPGSAPARHRQILAACGARIILFDDAATTAAREACTVGEVGAVALSSRLSGGKLDTVRPPAAAQVHPALAYVAFTSGSTGQPKGIVQSQTAFSQFLQWQQDVFDVGVDSRVAMWSSLAFDACYTEVFGALMAGATLCVPHPDLRRDPQYVIKWIEQAGITYLLTVPSFLALLVAELAASGATLASLRDVGASGEVLAPDLCGQFQQLLPSVRLHNLFGPTEAVLACSHLVTAPHSNRLRVGVGRPIAGRRLLLTDEQGRPVARGATGEINIVSRFLAEGFFENAAITPFPPFEGGQSHERIYRTGDYGRIGHDGVLHFLGRRDGQVKVRGVRIVVDEIESVLVRHAAVGSCAILDRATSDRGRQLVAFVVAAPNVATTCRPYEQAPRALQVAWRTLLLTSLDQYAVPAFFILTPALPRTATGKIDYLALREVDPVSIPAASPSAHEPGEEAAPEIVMRIRDAWRSVMPVWAREDDNFFDSGGDSIAAVRLHKALEHACPGMFQLIDIYANPSIEKMCEAVRLRPDGQEQAMSEGAQRALRRKSARAAFLLNSKKGDADASIRPRAPSEPLPAGGAGRPD